MNTTRVVIAGGPRTGKTTLAEAALEDVPGLRVRHTDDLIALDWSVASLTASKWLDDPGPWLIEGVAMPRALRKWLKAHDTGKPCDRVIWLGDPLEKLTPGQERMTKGCETVWAEIEQDLALRGVRIMYGEPGKVS